MKYYNFTEQQILDLRDKMPNNVAFGFQNYGKWYVDQDSIDKIDQSHGKMIDMAMQIVFGDTRENVLTAHESTTFETYEDYGKKAEEGFDAYRKIIGNIIAQGGIDETLDESINVYTNSLTRVRMMLKDGLYEMCLRYFYKNIKGQNVIPDEDFAEDIIVQLCSNWGATDEIIELIRTAETI